MIWKIILIWKDTHHSIEGLTPDNTYSISKKSHEVKGMSSETWFLQYNSGEGYTDWSQEHSGLYNSKMEEVWHNQEFSKSWLQSQTKQSRMKGLSKRCDQWPNGHSDWVPKILCVGMGQSSRRITNTAPHWTGHYNSMARSKPLQNPWKPTWSLKKAPEEMWGTRFFGLVKPRLNCLALMFRC